MERISGKWEFEKFIGYPFNSSSPPGNGQIIILNDDGTYERRSHDTVIFNGQYSIKERGGSNPLLYKSIHACYSDNATITNILACHFERSEKSLNHR